MHHHVLVVLWLVVLWLVVLWLVVLWLVVLWLVVLWLVVHAFVEYLCGYQFSIEVEDRLQTLNIEQQRGTIKFHDRHIRSVTGSHRVNGIRSVCPIIKSELAVKKQDKQDRPAGSCIVM